MKNHEIKPAKLALSLLTAGVLSFTLAACSSSSSSKKSEDETPPAGGGASTAALVSGVAAKGILQGALVQACSDTACNDVLASTDTKTDGSYELTIPDSFNGVAIIRVSQQNGAKMICDVADGCGDSVKFGDTVDMEDGLTLRSAANVEPGTTPKVHITPITDLLVTAAEQSRTLSSVPLDQNTLDAGKKAVQELLGLDSTVDITRVKPVDITKADADVSDDVAVQLSALSAAFAAKKDSADNSSIADRIANIAKAVKGKSIDKADLTALTAAAKKAVEAAAEVEGSKIDADKLNNKLAEAETKATEKCDNSGCLVAVDKVEPSAEALAGISTNVTAVKALVADVRNLGWEVYPALRDATNEDHEDYVANNLIGQAADASKIIDRDFEFAFDGIAELVDFSIHAYAENNSETNISKLAEAYFKDEEKWDYILEWKEDGNHTYDNEALVEDAQEFGKQFTGTFSKNGRVWTANNATYALDGKEELKATISNFEITFPSDKVSNKASSITAGVKATSSYKNTTADLDVQAEATFDKAISFESNDEPAPFITSAKMNGEATATNKKGNVTRTFAGKVSFEGGTPTAQRTLNAASTMKADSFLPKSASFDGKFSSSNYSGTLEAKINVSFDNYDRWTYHAEGTPVDVPAKLELSEDQKTLTISMGSGNEMLSYSATFLPSHFNDEMDDTHAIEVTQCTIKGSAWCSWMTHWGIEPLWGQELSLSDTSTILDAINADEWLKRDLFENYLETSNFGEVSFPEVNSLATSNFTNGVYELKAISDGHIAETANNYIQGTVTVELKGDISANLPEASIKLTANRSLFDQGKAELVVKWNDRKDNKDKTLVVNAELTGNKTDGLGNLNDDALRLFISDANGTKFTLSERKDKKDGVVGYIVKDGVSYAQITEEAGGYFVTYLVNDKGESVKDESEKKFDSLF